MSAWVEVSDGVFQRRYNPLDISVCVVRGDDGLLLVDTRSCPREADEIRNDLAELGDLPVGWVANTHAHYDHTFGNQRFGPGSDLNLPIYGHRLVPTHLDRYERPCLVSWVRTKEEPVADWRDVVVTPPTDLVDSRVALDIGGRCIEFVHLGRGHTDNDLLIHVPDARTWLVGDVVEESGPPVFGPDSFPLDWPGTTATLLARLTEDDIVVPGHGEAVSRGFVQDQHATLVAVARLIRELHGADVPEDQALATGGDRWPLPPQLIRPAVAEGYRQLRARFREPA